MTLQQAHNHVAAPAKSVGAATWRRWWPKAEKATIRQAVARQIQSVPTSPKNDPMWSWAVGATFLMTVLRLAAIRLSPLQLYADEAQYWLWSQHLAFGYFTKPPLLAWIIRATTLMGDAEPL